MRSHAWCAVGTTGGGLALGRVCTNATAGRWLSWPTVDFVFAGTLAKVQPACLDVTNHREGVGRTGSTCNSLLRTARWLTPSVCPLYRCLTLNNPLGFGHSLLVLFLLWDFRIAWLYSFLDNGRSASCHTA